MKHLAKQEAPVLEIKPKRQKWLMSALLYTDFMHQQKMLSINTVLFDKEILSSVATLGGLLFI